MREDTRGFGYKRVSWNYILGKRMQLDKFAVLAEVASSNRKSLTNFVFLFVCFCLFLLFLKVNLIIFWVCFNFALAHSRPKLHARAIMKYGREGENTSVKSWNKELK